MKSRSVELKQYGRVDSGCHFGGLPVILEGIPNIQDVYLLIDILEDFNVEVSFDEDEGIITIDPTNMISIPMPTGKIKSLCFVLFMGAILSKFGEGVIGPPEAAWA